MPRPLAVDDGRRSRPEHDDPQLVRPEHGLRDGARTPQAGARRSRGEHGRRQEAVRRVLPVGPRQDGPCGGVPLRRADPSRAPDDRSRSRGAVVGRDTRRRGERDAVRRVHAGICDRRDLRRDRAGPRHGRNELDGARDRPSRRGRAPGDDPLRRPRGRHGRRRHDAAVGARLADLDRLRRPRQGLSVRADRGCRCRCLCLEISASAAMATAGSENFFQAHHERGSVFARGDGTSSTAESP